MSEKRMITEAEMVVIEFKSREINQRQRREKRDVGSEERSQR